MQLYHELMNGQPFCYNGQPIEVGEDTPIILPKGDYVLSADQSTTATGIGIGDVYGNLYGVFLFKRSYETSPIEYKANFKRMFSQMIQYCNVHMIVQEDIFSQGFYHSDEVLSMMKYVFCEIKSDYKFNYQVEMIKHQDWKSNFIMTKDRSLTKKNVIATVRHMYPMFCGYTNDMEDCVGIYHHYKKFLMPNLLSGKDAVYKIHKSMPNNKRHNIYMRVVDTYDPSMIELNSEELKRVYTYGKRKFEFSINEWIDKVCRYLTSSSNAVWIAEIPESYKYIDALWYKYGIVPSDKKLYVICYRENKLKNAKLDNM